VDNDVRNRGMQAFRAKHVEAMNWSGMGVCEYAAALSLSPHAQRIWRDRLDEGEVEIDWRAHLHPSARRWTAGRPATGNPGDRLLDAPVEGLLLRDGRREYGRHERGPPRR
jgi:hypothetical protein